MMRIGVGRGAEGGARGEHAADGAGLGRQRDEGRELLFVGDGGDALRRADAEIDDAIGRQLEGGAARDDLARVERHFRHALDRHANLARQRWIIDDAVIHAVHLGLVGDDDAIDQNAGNLHVLRADRAGLDDALDLRDDDAAIVVRGHGLGEHVQRQRLLLHADVAGRVGAGAADEGHVDLRRRVEQPLLAVDDDMLDDLFGRHVIDACRRRSAGRHRYRGRPWRTGRAGRRRRRDRAAKSRPAGRL